ncbi:Uncharacterised protein [Mycobacteroides abscessus]|nr:Uncharacterised protein [Mycobacteroides abscessus]
MVPRARQKLHGAHGPDVDLGTLGSALLVVHDDLVARQRAVQAGAVDGPDYTALHVGRSVVGVARLDPADARQQVPAHAAPRCGLGHHLLGVLIGLQGDLRNAKATRGHHDPRRRRRDRGARGDAVLRGGTHHGHQVQFTDLGLRGGRGDHRNRNRHDGLAAHLGAARRDREADDRQGAEPADPHPRHGRRIALDARCRATRMIHRGRNPTWQLHSVPSFGPVSGPLSVRPGPSVGTHSDLCSRDGCDR